MFRNNVFQAIPVAIKRTFYDLIPWLDILAFCFFMTSDGNWGVIATLWKHYWLEGSS